MRTSNKMHIHINPISRLNGIVHAPGSKSYSHRAFVAAALSKGVSILRNPLTSGDVGVTIDLLRKIGIKILKKEDNTYVIVREAESFLPCEKILDCKNSGTTFRFFSALSLLIKGGLSLTGEFLEKKRPIIPLLEALKKLGANYNLNNDQISIKRIKNNCDEIQILGDISSQFITVLLFICPILHCENTCIIRINTTTPLVSYPYIQITKEILNSFGIIIQETIQPDNTANYIIGCDQTFRPQVYDIPGDFSSIAFLIAATVLTKKDSKVTIQNLDFQKPQGDKKFVKILLDMGAKIEVDENKHQLIVHGNIYKHPLCGINIDCRDVPDLFPILSVIGAFAKGKTILYNASHLRYKESDRIAILSRELQKLGVKVKENRDSLAIYQTKTLKGSNIDHENDHRIAMALIIACLFAKSSSELNNIEIINDSYPDFLTHLNQIGANIEFEKD